MADSKFETARARARLALVAPTVDDVSARYFEQLANVIFEEASRRGLNPDDEALFGSLDAIAKKYFAKELHKGEPSGQETSDDAAQVTPGKTV